MIGIVPISSPRSETQDQFMSGDEIHEKRTPPFPSIQSELPPLELTVEDQDGDMRAIRFGREPASGIHYLIVDRGPAKTFAYRYRVDPDSIRRFARRILELLERPKT